MGADVRSIRRNLGLSVPKFAAVLGVHQSTIHRWEAAGEEQPQIEGLPATMLKALRQRIHDEPRAEVVLGVGHQVSDALVVGGTLEALDALLAFARRLRS